MCVCACVGGCVCVCVCVCARARARAGTCEPLCITTIKIYNLAAYYIYQLNTDSLKPSSYYMCHQFNVQKFYVLLTQCTSIYVFCVDLRTNSDYFTIQH